MPSLAGLRNILGGNRKLKTPLALLHIWLQPSGLPRQCSSNAFALSCAVLSVFLTFLHSFIPLLRIVVQLRPHYAVDLESLLSKPLISSLLIAGLQTKILTSISIIKSGEDGASR